MSCSNASSGQHPHEQLGRTSLRTRASRNWGHLYEILSGLGGEPGMALSWYLSFFIEKYEDNFQVSCNLSYRIRDISLIPVPSV